MQYVKLFISVSKVSASLQTSTHLTSQLLFRLTVSSDFTVYTKFIREYNIMTVTCQILQIQLTECNIGHLFWGRKKWRSHQFPFKKELNFETCCILINCINFVITWLCIRKVWKHSLFSKDKCLHFVFSNG